MNNQLIRHDDIVVAVAIIIDNAINDITSGATRNDVDDGAYDAIYDGVYDAIDDVISNAISSVVFDITKRLAE